MATEQTLQRQAALGVSHNSQGEARKAALGLEAE
jgi:hypothetical protein